MIYKKVLLANAQYAILTGVLLLGMTIGTMGWQYTWDI